MSRAIVGFVLFGVAAVLLANRAEVATAQNPKDKDKERIALLEKQLAAAQVTIQQAAAQVTLLKQQGMVLQAEKAKADEALKKLKKEDQADDKTMKVLRADLDGIRKAGLIHVIVLRRKATEPTALVQPVIDDAYTLLGKIAGVRSVWAGRKVTKGEAAATEAEVVVTVLLDNAAAQKAFQEDLSHRKYFERHADKWEPPVTFDYEPKRNP